MIKTHNLPIAILPKIQNHKTKTLMVQKNFCRLRFFFDIQSKITSNITLLSFKVLSERFFHEVFKTGFTC